MGRLGKFGKGSAFGYAKANGNSVLICSGGGFVQFRILGGAVQLQARGGTKSSAAKTTRWMSASMLW